MEEVKNLKLNFGLRIGCDMVNANYFSQDKSPDKLFDKLIWTIDEVCKFTAYKKGTVYNLVSNGNIPYRKRGKRLFFIPCEILSWLKGE